MRAFYRNLLTVALCVAISVFMVAGIGHANGSHSVSKVKINVRAELEPFDTSPVTDAEGMARHHKEIRKGVVKKDELKGMVKILVPASALGITNEETAEHADIRLILSRNGADYAECLLEFDEIEAEDDDDDEEVQAHFRVHVRTKHGVPRAKKGTCDVDLTTAAIDLGVPDVQAGDLGTVALITDPNNRSLDVDFLDGIFEKP